MSAAPAIEVDEELRPYQIEESDLTFGKGLGKGMCGEVFLGNYNGKTCAIKVFGPFSDSYSVTCFLREISVLTAKHPTILQLVGFVPSVERPIVVSEFMCQGTLASVRQCRIEKKRWGITFNDIRLAQAFYGVAAGMEFLHSRNIIHRDLKPENVFLGAKAAPCVGDFGASRFLEATKEMDPVTKTRGVGTPQYMAPELIQNEDYTNKIDVFAFGVMVVVMFSYTEPLVLDSGLQLIDRNFHRFGEEIVEGNRLAKPKGIPDCYWDLATKCWDKDPEHRPTFTEIVDWMHAKEFAIDKKKVKEYEAYVQSLEKYRKKESE